MLAVFGSAALDTIRTPKKTVKCVPGGAAIFATISASYFVDTGMIAVVGSDFPKKYHMMLSKRVDLQGLTIAQGKTFHYDGIYDETLRFRKALRTDLNVLADVNPTVPEEYKKSQFVYLATNDPTRNLAIIKEFDNVKFSMCDTIDFWILKKRKSVIKMIKSVDAVVINDEEARLLTKEPNLTKCARKIMGWGARYVIIKKGEHGSLTFFEDVVFPSAGIPVADVVDPTGAGDSFAGAVMGYLADRNSTNLSDVKKAVVHGNVMGSFAVEGYGLDRLLRLKKSDISKRVKVYERMISLKI